MSKPQRPPAASNPEVGGIVHLEHVNFETPDQEMATVFFMSGLGLTRDPYARTDETNMGVNVGLQQFHLPRRGERTPPFHGVVGLVTPDLDGVRHRLALLEKAGRFAGTPFRCDMKGNALEVMSPFGYRLRLHPAGSIAALRPLGLAYVEVPVPPGRAEAIGGFYARVTRAPVAIAERDGARTASVTMGPHQFTHFMERELDDHDPHSMHIAYYITNYNEVRDVLRGAGALVGDARGEILFFDRVFDPDTGDTLFTINNEVRSVYHPDFMRPLANRWPLVSEPFRDQTQAMAALAAEVGFVPGTR